MCFDLLNIIPYLYKTKHNGDEPPKDRVSGFYLFTNCKKSQRDIQL